MINKKEVLNSKEAADYLGVYIETVRRLARKHQIPSYKVGKDWRFRREALKDWTETHHLRYKSPIVLVIENDAGLRRVMKRFLETAGYSVRLASEGAEGLAILDRESIDLILLDLKMTGMNGPEFLREFRKEHNMIPVIVVTGYPDSDLMMGALKYGPFTMMAKPVSYEQLIETVRMVLNGAYEARASM